MRGCFCLHKDQLLFLKCFATPPPPHHLTNSNGSITNAWETNKIKGGVCWLSSARRVMCIKCTLQRRYYFLLRMVSFWPGIIELQLWDEAALAHRNLFQRNLNNINIVMQIECCRWKASNLPKCFIIVVMFEQLWVLWLRSMLNLMRTRNINRSHCTRSS